LKSILNMKYRKGVFLLLLLLFITALRLSAQQNNIDINIHLRGVYESKISLLPMVGNNALRPILEKGHIKDGSVCKITIPKERLPGQFVLRFDYKEKKDGSPYPVEKYFFVSNQNLELWVHPLHISKPDSTYFQKGEIENSLFDSFMKENSLKKKNLALLRNFLIEYDNPKSKFYKLGIAEYENRRKEYNKWLSRQKSKNKEVFVSHLFSFQYVSSVAWGGDQQARIESMTEHYFDGIDFRDPLLVKTMDMRKWIDSYVNIYGAKATTIHLRDSLFTLAGKRAIEKSKQGHPIVYGWMVDYFYRGFESFDIQQGMKMLETYIADPNCLTKKKMEIQKRLDGMKNMMIGSVAPDFKIEHESGDITQFLEYYTDSKYKLVLFWSADCYHCKEEVEKLNSWYKSLKNKKTIDIFAISLDESETEIQAWNKLKKQYFGWHHIRAKGGINSAVANAYYILSVPVMVLVDTLTNEIVAFPKSIEGLQKKLVEG